MQSNSFPDSSVGKESACNVGDRSSIPGLGRSPGEGKKLPTPVFGPGELPGLNSQWGLQELNRTERHSLFFFINPLLQVGLL